jgi:NADH:ubiquinone reductase (H+-translocating)
LKTAVKKYDGRHVEFKDGKRIPTQNVIWAAGTKGALLPGIPEEVVIKGRVRVNAWNQMENHAGVFVIGDLAAGHPMLAPVAIQQAKKLAENFKRLARQEPMRPFQYKNRGVMATIGRNRAVVDLPGIKFDGPFAWFIWLLVHLMSLVGFRNKIMAFITWAYSYFTFNSGLRLVIDASPSKPPGPASTAQNC